MTLNVWKLAQVAAQAIGSPVHIIARPSGTWCASAGHVEIDADTPYGALTAVINELQRNAAAMEAKSTADARQWMQARSLLAEIAVARRKPEET